MGWCQTAKWCDFKNNLMTKMIQRCPITQYKAERRAYNDNNYKSDRLCCDSKHCSCLPYRHFLPLFFLHRPNSFVIITANRVLHCNADTPEEMHHWITLLQRSKGDTRVEGQEFIVRGKNFLKKKSPARAEFNVPC